MAAKDRDHVLRLREEANAIRKAEAARKRRNRVVAQLSIIGGAIVAIAAVVVLVIFGPQWFGPKVTPFDSSGQAQVQGAQGAPAQVPVVSTADGRGIVLGADSAANKVDIYFDFSCPHCQDYHQAVGGDIDAAIASGNVQVTFYPINIVAPYGQQAGGALASVAKYAPEQTLTVLDGLFGIPAQQQTGWSANDYAQALKTLGVTNQEAIDSAARGDYVRWVVNNTTDRPEEITGTPTVLVNGVKQETLPDQAAFQALAQGLPLPAAPTAPAAG